MSLVKGYDPTSNICYRIRDHLVLGLSSDIGDRKGISRNHFEKGGDTILWTVGLVPKAVKAFGKSFQDPRVITVALTALALFTNSMVFYPTITLSVAKATYINLLSLNQYVPLWSVKLATYLTICASMIGAGLRAGGRFGNAELMKEFYNIPSGYPQHPARLYASEIKDIVKTKQTL